MKKPYLKKLYTCECHGQGLAVEAWEEEKMVFVCLWNYGKTHPLSWRERLRYCWRTLIKGEPYFDDICFSASTAEAFAEDLLKCAKELQGDRNGIS